MGWLGGSDVVGLCDGLGRAVALVFVIGLAFVAVVVGVPVWLYFGHDCNQSFGEVAAGATGDCAAKAVGWIWLVVDAAALCLWACVGIMCPCD